MSVVVINPRQQRARDFEWARLIPGEMAVSPTGSKKKPQSVKTFLPANDFHVVSGERKNENTGALGLLIPMPLRSRRGTDWLRSMAVDWVLIALNWLLMGALLVPLRTLFPRVYSFRYAAGTPVTLVGMAVLHAALITLLGYTEGLHLAGSDLRERARVLGRSVVWATVVLCFAYGLQGAPWIVGALLCATGCLNFGVLCIWRWRNRSNESPGFQSDIRNVLIVGANGVGRRIASFIQQNPGAGRRICGFLDAEKPLSNGVVGRISDLARMARQGFVDEIILAAPRNSDVIREVLSEARRLHLDVEIVPELFGCDPAGQEIERLAGMPVICLHAERLPAVALFVKRGVDVLVSGIALAALSPVFAVISALIKLDSTGPVFYRAQRAGRKGRFFVCQKFRTMVCNADTLKLNLRRNNERAGPFFKIADDPRITRLGRVLRRYSLDELPQLWNVLRGEMSLVGPRPHPLDDVASYQLEHLARLDVTPGLTGLWQITARRDPSFDRGMQLDREYIRSWSLSLDLRILLRTFVTVVQGSGD